MLDGSLLTSSFSILIPTILKIEIRNFVFINQSRCFGKIEIQNFKFRFRLMALKFNNFPNDHHGTGYYFIALSEFFTAPYILYPLISSQCEVMGVYLLPLLLRFLGLKFGVCSIEKRGTSSWAGQQTNITCRIVCNKSLLP